MLKTVIIGTPVVKGGPLPRLEQSFFRYQFSWYYGYWVQEGGKGEGEGEEEGGQNEGNGYSCNLNTKWLFCEILILLYGLV